MYLVLVTVEIDSCLQFCLCMNIFVIFCFYHFCFRLPRPSGSDSDTDDDQHAGHQPPTAVRSVSTVGPPPADPPRIVRPHPLAAHHNSTPSPQLSLAEFLQVE